MFNFESLKDGSSMVPDLSGRKEGCEFTGVVRNPDQSITFNFESKGTGEVLGHREFPPKKLDDQSIEDFKKSVVLGVQRIAHICRAFVTEEEFKSVKVEDPDNMAKVDINWTSITQQVGKLLKGKLESKADVKCALKVVYNKNKDKYYSGLPKVPPFISTASHPKVFHINPQYDFLIMPSSVPDAEKLNNQGAAGTASSVTGAGATSFSGAAAGNGDF